MRTFILVSCLIVCIYAYKHHSNLNVGKPEYTKVPAKYELGKGVSFLKSKDLIIKNVFKNFKKALEDDPGIEAILNEYADEIFTNLDKLIIDDGFDPVELPEEHADFNYTLIITYYGGIDLTNGWLSDISTLHRGDDVVVNYSTINKYLEISIPIALDDLEFSYDYKAQILGLGPAGSIDGKITDIKVYVTLGFDVVALQATIEEFYITHTGDIKINFEGNAVVDWLLDLLTDVVTGLLKEVILLVVEGVIRGGLEQAVDAINDAINSALNPTTAAPSTTVASFMLN